MRHTYKIVLALSKARQSAEKTQWRIDFRKVPSLPKRFFCNEICCQQSSTESARTNIFLDQTRITFIETNRVQPTSPETMKHLKHLKRVLVLTSAPLSFRKNTETQTNTPESRRSIHPDNIVGVVHGELQKIARDASQKWLHNTAARQTATESKFWEGCRIFTWKRVRFDGHTCC